MDDTDSWQTVTKAKSKQNASQRSKDTSKQPSQSTNNQKSATVPTSQPAKANNKTSKKNDLNLKGASKEGTDMDAFNDNVITDQVNANINVLNANNDILNANSVITDTTTNTSALPVETNNKKIDSNESATITTKQDVKPLPKPKVDVTNVFDKLSQNAKPFIPPVVVPAVATLQQQSTPQRDEVDRAALTTEKIVKVKNDVNAKVSETAVNNVGDVKPELPYKADQWAPSNPAGKKVYDRDFLLAVRDLPSAKIRPENLPPSIYSDERARIGERYSMGARNDYTNIPFPNYGGKSMSQRGSIGVSKRGSQSGKINNSKGSKSNNGPNKISISLREDVKLHQSENAWKPARLVNKPGEYTPDDKKTDILYKKVRGVLNKLTPQKFEKLVQQVRDLQIDTEDRLQGVIDLVFEKAVDEPNFSVAYALMCKELGAMQVPSAKKHPDDKPEYVHFRKLLITRCQVEFEKQSKDESSRNDKVAEIEQCTDPVSSEKRAALEVELEEYDRRIRMRSVGNIRFIGELFKIQMLTSNIMLRCLDNLLKNKDEDRLECLCKLLTTIGKDLEITKQTDLTNYFKIMSDIVDKKYGNVSSRIRFMLQDVIDLRRNKWIPRRQDLNPKTMEQIQKEAENEQFNQVLPPPSNTPRKDDRSMKNKRNVNVSDDGWQMPNSSRPRPAFNVQSDKLKNKPPAKEEPLGGSHMFQLWCRGSAINKNQPSTTPPLPSTANKFAALGVDSDVKHQLSNNPGRPRESGYNSKGSSLERNTFRSMQYDGQSSRSSSQQRSNDSSNSSSQRSTPAPLTPVEQQKPIVPPAAAPVAAEQSAQLTEEQLERFVRNCLDEYIQDLCTFEQYDSEIRKIVPASYLKRMVADQILYVLEKFKGIRRKTGSAFANLIKTGTLPLEEFCIGLEEILNMVEDLVIDIPLLWDYIADILVPLICEEVLPLSRLHKSFEVLISQKHATKLLVPLFKSVITEKGPNFLKTHWEISGVSISDFMPNENANEIERFIKENQFDFLSGGDTPIGQSTLSYEQIQIKLLEFFNLNTEFDHVVNWITANVGKRVKEKEFVRTLATAIFTNSINRAKLVQEKLQKHSKLLQKYVDNIDEYELECLYALQALVHKLEHPQGLLLSICDSLSDDCVFSQESFVAWQNSTDPKEQEGKGVALKQLTSFFTRLLENDDEEEYDSSANEEA